MKITLQANNLTKDFGHNRGVFDVSLALAPGEIVGFVGPNGAGKSTTINLLAGLIKADGGQIELFEHRIKPTTIYRDMPRIGLLLSEPTLDQRLTGAKTFQQSQALLGGNYRARWQAMSKLLNLDTTKPIKKLSLGNKKKVGIINALLHQPELIIMDEPTSGLDPIVQSNFSGLLRKAAQQGSAVLLSSHDLGEVQHLCDRIIMIRDGRIILTGTTASLLEKATKVFTLQQPPTNLVHQVQGHFPTARISRQGSAVIIYTKEHRQMLQLLLRYSFYDFYVERPSLEDMFQEYYA